MVETQRKYFWHRAIHLTGIVALIVLLNSSCSPLYLVNTLSTGSDSVTIVNQRYGEEQRQQLDVFLPERIVADSPVIVFFYGGSWKRGEKEKYRFVGYSLASRGFITVIPNYRLYPEVTFPAFVEDGAKALAWVYEHVAHARNGLVVMGHSAGAHTAALLALDQRYLEDVGQSSHIIRGMIGLAGPYGFNPKKYRSTRPIFADVDVIEKAMPVTFACSIKKPLLLFHGSDDSIVTPEYSRELKRRVDACAGDITYFELDNIGHFFIVLGLSDSFLAEEKIQSSIQIFLQSLSLQSG